MYLISLFNYKKDNMPKNEVKSSIIHREAKQKSFRQENIVFSLNKNYLSFKIQ